MFINHIDKAMFILIISVLSCPAALYSRASSRVSRSTDDAKVLKLRHVSALVYIRRLYSYTQESDMIKEIGSWDRWDNNGHWRSL